MPASTLKSKLIDLLFKAVCRFFRIITPIRDRVLIVSHSKIEDNAVEMANYLAENYKLPVILILPKDKLAYVNSIKKFSSLELVPPPKFNPKRLKE